MDSLLKLLIAKYPFINFAEGAEYRWSPRRTEVTYKKNLKLSRTAPWSLLHEVGHALLNHKSYRSDLELISMESEAWSKAQEIGKQYGYEISDDHIQNCMDTYRDWLHQRSACPVCDNRSLQQDSKHYKCFNCGQIWSVSSSRFCRPYRLTKQTKTPP